MKKFRKPVKVGNFSSNNYIEWESNGDRNKTLSIEEYLKKISPYLSDITYAPKKPYTRKIRYQIGLATSMWSSDFIFDCVHLLYYKCHEINPNCSGSYIDSPQWIKNKKATTYPIIKRGNGCFQYPATIALN